MSQRLHKAGLEALGELAEKKWLRIGLLILLAIVVPLALYISSCEVEKNCEQKKDNSKLEETIMTDSEGNELFVGAKLKSTEVAGTKPQIICEDIVGNVATFRYVDGLKPRTFILKSEALKRSKWVIINSFH